MFLGAPYVAALRGAKALNAALSAVTAAVVGVILNPAAVWFGVHVAFRQTLRWRGHGLALDAPMPASLDPFATALAVAAALALFRFRAGVIPTLFGCSVAGVLLQLALGGVR